MGILTEYAADVAFNLYVGQRFSPTSVYSIESHSETRIDETLLSDLYFSEVPSFYYPSTLLPFYPDPSRDVVANLSSSGSTVLLSFPGLSRSGADGSDAIYPTAWHVKTDTVNLLCLCNPFGGDLNIRWMSSGVTTAQPLKLSGKTIRILEAHVSQDMPAIVPLSALLNATATFTVIATFVCDQCIDSVDLGFCTCEPVLIANVISLDSPSKCRDATISSKSSNGLNAFGSHTCRMFLDPTRGRLTDPQTSSCRFSSLVIDSGTFGCRYKLQVISPYSGSAVAYSSNFTLCAVNPLQLDNSSLCSLNSTLVKKYSSYTWTGVLLPPGPPPNFGFPFGFITNFIDMTATAETVKSISPGKPVSLAVNLCGGSVYSMMSQEFQPNFPAQFKNPSEIMQLQVNVRSTLKTEAEAASLLVATCSLFLYSFKDFCYAVVVSGKCLISGSCVQRRDTEKAFFCQHEYNPNKKPDLQLQLYFDGIVLAKGIGDFKITIDGSGSGAGSKGDWGFASPSRCVECLVCYDLFSVNSKALQCFQIHRSWQVVRGNDCQERHYSSQPA
jgi:hypothetical protein